MRIFGQKQGSDPGICKIQGENILKKRIYTGFLIVCILAVYIMMFGLSAQNGLESGGLSFFLSKKLMQIADCFEAGEWSLTELDSRAALLQFFVRKAAHFSEYGLLGGLEYLLACEWIQTDKKRIPLVGGILFLSGLVDEFHQWFVPGRYASIWDVCLDFAGGMTGMLLLLFIRRIALGRKKLLCQSNG